MAQIPSWLWLSAGIIVTVGSQYVKGPVELFFYLGLLFIVIGIAKISIWFMVKTPKKTHSRIQPPKSKPAQQVQGNYKKCACGRFVRLTDSFCWGCGRRLR